MLTWDGFSAVVGYDGGYQWFIDSSSTDLLSEWKATVATALRADAPWLSQLVKAPDDTSSWLFVATVTRLGSGDFAFDVTTRKALYLLSDLSAQLQIASTGITLPKIEPVDDAPTRLVNLVTDAAGSLTQLSVGLAGDWTIASIAQRLGMSWSMPPDVITISEPHIVVARTAGATVVQIRVRATVPTLDIKNVQATIVVKGVQFGLLRFDPAASFAGGLLSISNLSVAAYSNSVLQFQGSISFLGIPLSGGVNMTSRALASIGSGLSLSVSAPNVNLTEALLDYRMWDAAPDLVLRKIAETAFANLQLSSSGGSYYGVAGPNANASLFFGLDGYGLRYIRLSVTGRCLSLSQLAKEMAFGFDLPSDTVASLCDPSVELVPYYIGAPNFAWTDGRLFQPSGTVRFGMSLPDLSPDVATAALTFKGSTGESPASFSVKLLSPISVLNNWAAVKDVALTLVPDSGFTVNATISVPELGLVDASCWAEYTDPTRTFLFKFAGLPKLVNGLVAIDSLALKVPRGSQYAEGSARGSIAGFTGAVTFNLSRPSVATLKPTMSLSFALPNITLGPLVTALLPGVALNQFLPSSFTGAQFPQVQISAPNTTVGVHRLQAGPTSNGVTADVVFDSTGPLLASLGLDKGMDLAALLADVGIPLPVDTNGMISVSNAALTVVSNRTGYNLTEVAGRPVKPPGAYLVLTVSIPALEISSLASEIQTRDAQGRLQPTVVLTLNQTVSVAGGLLVLSGVSITAVQGTGLLTRANASFFGITFGANLTLTKPPVGGVSLAGTLRTFNVSLLDAVKHPRMWTSPPALVTTKLTDVVFPVVSVDVRQGAYYISAGPVGGTSLSIILDARGLRHIRIGMAADYCPGLGQLWSDIGVSLSLPDGLTMSACGPALEYTPYYAGAANFVTSSNTTLVPGGTVSAAISIPGISINKAPAKFVYTDASGQAPAEYRIQVTGAASIFSEYIVLKGVGFTIPRGASYFAGTANASFLGSVGSASFNVTRPAGVGLDAAASSKVSLSITLPNVKIGELFATIFAGSPRGNEFISDIFSFVADALLRDVRLSTVDLDSGLFRLQAGPLAISGITHDYTVDKSGIAFGTLGLDQNLDIVAALSAFGVQLPADIVNGILTMSKPSLSFISNRTDVNITGINPSFGKPPGVYLNFGLRLPLLDKQTFLCEVLIKDASGNKMTNIVFQMNQAIALAGGLFRFESMNLTAIKGFGLQSLGSARFLGVPLSSNINITTIGGRSGLNFFLNGSDANLGTAIKDARMWPAAPTFVTRKLSEITFQSFGIMSEMRGDVATVSSSDDLYFYGYARPKSGPGANAAIAMDTTTGLRYIKIDLDGLCLALGLLLNDMGLGANVPDNVFTLCSPYVQFVPFYPGKPNLFLSNGTELIPSGELGFTLSIPDIGVNGVRSRLYFAGATGQSPATYVMQVIGSIPTFNNWATLKDLSITLASGVGFESSVLITVPDLRLRDAICTLSYSIDTGVYVFQVSGIGAILYGALKLQAISLAIPRKGTFIAGKATASVASYSATAGFNFTVPSDNTTKSVLSLFVSFPSASVGTVLGAVGPSVADLLPGFIKNVELPSLLIAASTAYGGLFSIQAGPTSAGLAADLLFDSRGVVKASLTMEASLDIGSALKQIANGVSLPFDVSDILTIRNPSVYVVSSRAASLGVDTGTAGMFLEFGLSIPLLMSGSSLPAVMQVFDGNRKLVPSFTLSWRGSYSPVQYVTLNGASVVLAAGKGLLVVADRASKDRGAKSLTLKAEARKVSAADTLQTLFPATPEFIIMMLKPAKMSRLIVTWDGDFNVTGSPDLSGVPGLSDILDFLGFSGDDIKLTPKLGSLQIVIEKTWVFNIGEPFVGPSYLSFGFGFSLDGANFQFFCSAQFRATMRMPIFEPDYVGFLMGAKVQYDTLAPPPGISFILTAYATSTIQIKGFPFIVIDYIGGSIGLAPIVNIPWVILTYIEFAAKGSILDTKVDIAVVFDRPKMQFGIRLAVENFDLQRMLNQLSVPADLGPYQIQVYRVKVSFARQTLQLTVGEPIPMGLYLDGNMTFMSIKFAFKVAVDTDGLILRAQVSGVQDAQIVKDAIVAAQAVVDA
ncbi:hypothetical protein GPECTOR_12g379 [Gonium pectorale]|uniref:Uncharacterized protein n=1 Tax=Gonium pectorale TaxID=33097 RepID=A0A150GNM8_GONPE|nr:hypothetical protein GPECTOR_12g379 [Gonium pectorale]|eukprot:KXZ51417.1 hypothetical protein GPECTOR_12g379 [Gonium pectorale]